MSIKPTPTQFQKIIWDYYQEHKRSFAWRDVDDPYFVLVSEIMLQQTQTHRVIPKFDQFITAFPTIDVLAQASLKDVLFVWQGLGYNRRAKALHTTAQLIVKEHNGKVPNNSETLVSFPGIGKATAASICAFAFNKPTIFIETNIRTVFISFFFQNQTDIHDNDIFPLIEKTLDVTNPRQWYYALMDYGVMLKKQLPNPSRKSKHHTKQSKFEGSDRQIRGMILKHLLQCGATCEFELIEVIPRDVSRIRKILDQLLQEQFLKEDQGYIEIRETAV